MNFLPTSLKGALLATTVIAVPSVALAQEEAPAEDVEEIVVLGQYVPDEKRNTSEISNVLDAESFQRTGDGDIAVALSRVTGLSLVAGKFVFVRGLGGRYSQTTLDGATLASPIPLQRAVPLDIFPTSLLSEVLVQKTFSPEYGLDFAGGSINLRTKAIPDEFFFEFGVSAGVNTVSTFDEGLSYDAPDIEFTTFGGAGRNLPQGFVDAIANTTLPVADGLSVPAQGATDSFVNLTDTQIEGLAESLPNRWSIDAEPNMPNQSYNLAIGDKFDVGESRLGFVASVNYGYEAQNRFGVGGNYTGASLAIRDDFNPSNSECQAAGEAASVPFISDECGFYETNQTFSLNGMVSVGLELDPANIFQVTSLVLRQSTKTGLIRLGEDGDRGSALTNNFRTDWVERQVWYNQISGEHEWNLFGDSDTFFDTIVEWRANYTRTDRDAPLRNEVTYSFEPDRQDANGDPLNFVILPTDAGNMTTSFNAMDDDQIELGFDIVQPMTLLDKPVDFKFGYTYFDKQRTFVARQYEFLLRDYALNNPLGLGALTRVPELILSPNNIGPGLVSLADRTQAGDYSEMGLEMHQAYFGVDIQLTERLRLAHGWRYESSTQETLSGNRASIAREIIAPNEVAGVGDLTVLGPNVFVNTNGGISVGPEAYFLVSNKLERFYPSATLTYEFAENMQVRGGYSKTINRPDLRELSSARFLNPETQELEEGNPVLQASIIDNYDLRFEWYFGLGESFTLGAFYKQFDRPIEQAFNAASNTIIQTFINSSEAEVYGIEAEIDKTLDLEDWFGWKWLGDRIPFIKANASYIESEVTLVTDPNNPIPGSTANQATNNVRRLQGQSDVLINVQLGYDDFNKGEQMVLALNYTSDRIFLVGSFGAPDIIETPPVLLKFVYRREFEAFGTPLKFSFEADNLLDDDIVRKQTATDGSGLERIQRQFDIGRTFTVGLSYEF